jgi:sugar transferase (PEP-CTERM/EpsH1 system associated)
VCLTKYTDFAKKITRPDVEIIALNKPPGLGLSTHVQLFKLLRRMRPAILHTYNLAAVEYAAIAVLAGVPVRVHAEHGRDARDPNGTNWKHNLLRRLLTPVIDTFVPVSPDLRSWLGKAAGVPDAKNLLIDNGVDTRAYAPAKNAPRPDGWPDFGGAFVFGTVGRIQDVKDHAGLVDAFAALRERMPATNLRLVIVGDGPLRPALAAKVKAAGLDDHVFLPGARNDIAAWAASPTSWPNTTPASWSLHAIRRPWRRRSPATSKRRCWPRNTASPAAAASKRATASTPCWRPTWRCTTASSPAKQHLTRQLNHVRNNRHF